METIVSHSSRKNRQLSFPIIPREPKSEVLLPYLSIFKIIKHDSGRDELPLHLLLNNPHPVSVSCLNATSLQRTSPLSQLRLIYSKGNIPQARTVFNHSYRQHYTETLYAFAFVP
jgi:hypothetical protein